MTSREKVHSVRYACIPNAQFAHRFDLMVALFQITFLIGFALAPYAAVRRCEIIIGDDRRAAPAR